MRRRRPTTKARARARGRLLGDELRPPRARSSRRVAAMRGEGGERRPRWRARRFGGEGARGGEMETSRKIIGLCCGSSPCTSSSSVAWFAGIFYLPRLFVYHAMATDSPSQERFEVMERKLYRGIMTPSHGAHDRFRGLAVAGLRHRRRMAAREAGARGAPRRLPLLDGRHRARLRRAAPTAAPTCSTAGSTKFPVVLLAGIVILAVVKPF